MKIVLSFIIISCSLLNLNAQNYFPEGAIWHYNLPSFSSASFSYTTIESLGDSIFNGDTLIYLEGSVACSQGSNEFIKQEGQKIYKLNKCDSTFSLLYDFGAVQGDTVIIHSDICSSNNDTILLLIDSVNTININANIRNQFFTTQLNFSSGITFNGNIIEGIGNLNSFYPLDGLCDPNGGPLRCYADTSIGFYSTGLVNGSCDTSYTVGINETLSNSSVRIFPNPTKNKIKIVSKSKIKSIHLFDLRGTELITTKQNEIDLLNFPSGIYLVKIQLENEVLYKKVLKN